MNIITMKSPHQQQVFEKLRSRFGMPGEAGFSPKSNASAAPSAFPAALLKTGLRDRGTGQAYSLSRFRR